MIVPVVTQWVTGALAVLEFPLAFHRIGKLPGSPFWPAGLSFRRYSPGASYQKLKEKRWKKLRITGMKVDLCSSGADELKPPPDCNSIGHINISPTLKAPGVEAIIIDISVMRTVVWLKFNLLERELRNVAIAQKDTNWRVGGTQRPSLPVVPRSSGRIVPVFADDYVRLKRHDAGD